MRITCDNNGMGYIYLKPAGHNDRLNRASKEKHIIPYSKNEALNQQLDQLTISSNTFRYEVNKSFQTEYGIDFDEQGYINGIELSLNPPTFIALINKLAFEVVSTQWKETTFHLITFDLIELVLSNNNRLYKLTEAADTYAIVALVEPESLGITYSTDEPHLPIALIKGIVTSRNDIYNLEYLCQPDFVIR